MLILDTNVISEIMKPAAMRSADVIAWLRAQLLEDLYTTMISLAEIRSGIEILPEGKRRNEKRRAADELFSEIFPQRVLPFDEPAAYAYVDIVTSRRRNRKTLDPLDMQITAIAKSRMMSVATRNTYDFEGSGVPIINPWGTDAVE
jgi:predicted nucleic acid-binding protein